MKWVQAHLLCLHIKNEVIRKSALAWKKRYDIPRNRCYSLIPPVQWGNDFCLLQQNSLAQVGPGDKLIIVAHGSESSVHGYDPEALAELLANNGLQHAGLIAFKACLVGKGNYLDVFRNECVIQGMQIGWFNGYKDKVATIGGHEFVDKTHDYDSLPFLFRLIGFSGRAKDEDAKRVKVVRGNVALVNTASSRYSA